MIHSNQHQPIFPSHYLPSSERGASVFPLSSRQRRGELGCYLSPLFLVCLQVMYAGRIWDADSAVDQGKLETFRDRGTQTLFIQQFLNSGGTEQRRGELLALIRPSEWRDRFSEFWMTQMQHFLHSAITSSHFHQVEHSAYTSRPTFYFKQIKFLLHSCLWIAFTWFMEAARLYGETRCRSTATEWNKMSRSGVKQWSTIWYCRSKVKCQIFHCKTFC